MRPRAVPPDGGVCTTTNTAASKSAGSPRRTVLMASTPPAEAPITTTSRLANAPPPVAGPYRRDRPVTADGVPSPFVMADSHREWQERGHELRVRCDAALAAAALVVEEAKQLV